MIHTSKIIPRLYYTFLLPPILLIFLRPLTFSVGDFLIYYKGSTQIIHGIDLYKISLENFGTRFFNGPIWGYFISPITILDSGIALIIFRIFSAVLCIFYLPKVLKESDNKDIFLFFGIFLLMFPVRMNMNLAQGAAIAGSLFLYVIRNIILKNDRLHQILIQSLLMTIAFNYKPLLGGIFFIYLLFKNQVRLIILFIVINISYISISLYFNKSISYYAWFQLMKERNSRIIQGGYENIVGPWAFVARILHMNPIFILAIQLILISLLIVYLYATKKRKFDIDEAVILLSAGTLLGLYSPAQDSFILSSYLILRYFSQLRKERGFLLNKILFGMTMGFWSASTETSFVKSLIIITLVSILLCMLKIEYTIVYSVIISSFISQIILLLIKYDHINYDLAGFATLIGNILLVLNLFRRHKKVFYE